MLSSTFSSCGPMNRRAVDSRRGARSDRADGRDHAGRVKVLVDLAREVLVRLAVGQQPGTGEVVLHHGDPAVGRRGDELGLVLFDVAEFDLLELLGVGVERRASEGGIKRRLARRLVAVAHQLHVQLRVDGLAALVDHFVTHVDHVGAALERVGLDQAHAALLGRFEAQHQLVGAVGQTALAAEAHRRLVGGERPADQARLRLVDAAALVSSSTKGWLGVAGFGELAELALDDRAALGVEHQLQHVGADLDALARPRRRPARRAGGAACGGGARNRRHRPRRARHGRRHRRCGCAGARGRRRRAPGKKVALRPL
jgi:hypothetical protein